MGGPGLREACLGLGELGGQLPVVEAGHEVAGGQAVPLPHREGRHHPPLLGGHDHPVLGLHRPHRGDPHLEGARARLDDPHLGHPLDRGGGRAGPAPAGDREGGRGGHEKKGRDSHRGSRSPAVGAGAGGARALYASRAAAFPAPYASTAWISALM